MCYLAFKRLEPHNPYIHLALLVLVPILLAILTLPHFPNVLAALVPVLFLHNFTILVLVAAYRLSPFHPLAAFPGPLLNRLTKLRMVRVMESGHQHWYDRELHRQYGDIVRTGAHA